MSLPRWAVVVVNYRSSGLLARHLAFTDDLPDDAITIVVDNFSDPAELTELRTLAEARGWIVVASPRNVGFGAAVNLGAAEAFDRGCAGLLLVNPDARIDAATATALMATSLESPRTLASPLVRDAAGAVTFRGAEVGLRTGRIRGLGPVLETPDGPRPGASRLAEPALQWLTGACLAVHRELFTELGGFDPGYFMYWEDVDFSVRATRVGAALALRLDLAIEHDEGGTQLRRGAAKSNLYYAYNARNRLRFATRNVPRGARASWVRSTPAVTREIYLRGGRRQLVSSPWSLTHAIRGALRGLVLVARSGRSVA